MDQTQQPFIMTLFWIWNKGFPAYQTPFRRAGLPGSVFPNFSTARFFPTRPASLRILK